MKITDIDFLKSFLDKLSIEEIKKLKEDRKNFPESNAKRTEKDIIHSKNIDKLLESY